MISRHVPHNAGLGLSATGALETKSTVYQKTTGGSQKKSRMVFVGFLAAFAWAGH